MASQVFPSELLPSLRSYGKHLNIKEEKTNQGDITIIHLKKMAAWEIFCKAKQQLESMTATQERQSNQLHKNSLYNSRYEDLYSNSSMLLDELLDI